MPGKRGNIVATRLGGGPESGSFAQAHKRVVLVRIAVAGEKCVKASVTAGLEAIAEPRAAAALQVRIVCIHADCDLKGLPVEV